MSARRFWVKAVGVVALLGAATVVVGTPASAAPKPVAPGAVAAALPFDINGHWTDNGSAKPVISAAGGAVLIDMSYAHRPTALGSVLDASSILMTFPDAGPFIGTFLTPTTLRWSNGSVWRKVYGGPTVINLNDVWTDGLTDQHVSQVDGYIAVDMSAVHRPNATGFMTGPDLFLVSFPDDRDTTFATLRAGFVPSADRIVWSNGSQWRREIAGQGPPGCLRAATVLC
ncbi:MAG: hypothetical protein V7637_4780 [Mycobacteriales bacterium]